MAKQAALLLNLGSPDSPEVGDVRRYLREFLMDGRVLDAPYPVRWFVVNCLILPKRPKQSAEAYASVWTDEGAPLIVTSEAQQKLLGKAMPETPIYLAMRYGKPSIPDVIGQIKADGIEELFVMPLYPHYAMSSYETVVVRAEEELRAQAPQIRTTLLQPFYQDEDYIEALYTSAAPYLENDYDKLLFSFHGVPERHLRKGDPSKSHCLVKEDCCNCTHPVHAVCYRHQCLATVEAFVQRAGIPRDKYFTSFQSRLGRDPWLTPYTDETLKRFGREGVKRVLVMTPAFVTDCLETLEEIAEEGKETFVEHGGESLQLIPCLNEHPAWIQFLAERLQLWQGEPTHAAPADHATASPGD